MKRALRITERVLAVMMAVCIFVAVFFSSEEAPEISPKHAEAGVGAGKHRKALKRQADEIVQLRSIVEQLRTENRKPPRRRTEQPAPKRDSGLTYADRIGMTFESPWSKLKPRFDEACELFDLPKTEDSYTRMASVIIALSKENGGSRAGILESSIAMKKDVGPEVNLSFPEAATLVSVKITGDL